MLNFCMQTSADLFAQGRSSGHEVLDPSLVLYLNQCFISARILIGEGAFMPPRRMGTPCSFYHNFVEKLYLGEFTDHTLYLNTEGI
jgi:hypothetical protein